MFKLDFCVVRLFSREERGNAAAHIQPEIIPRPLDLAASFFFYFTKE
jgi:hypothetical protein